MDLELRFGGLRTLRVALSASVGQKSATYWGECSSPVQDGFARQQQRGVRFGKVDDSPADRSVIQPENETRGTSVAACVFAVLYYTSTR